MRQWPVTESVTERVTESVTENVTERVTENVTESVTESVTENVTENVTESVCPFCVSSCSHWCIMYTDESGTEKRQWTEAWGLLYREQKTGAIYAQFSTLKYFFEKDDVIDREKKVVFSRKMYF